MAVSEKPGPIVIDLRPESNPQVVFFHRHKETAKRVDRTGNLFAQRFRSVRGSIVIDSGAKGNRQATGGKAKILRSAVSEKLRAIVTDSAVREQSASDLFHRHKETAKRRAITPEGSFAQRFQRTNHVKRNRPTA